MRGDTTAGNRFGVYRGDNLVVQTTTDSGGGWNVGDTATGEWLQWKEVPMQGTMNLRFAWPAPNTGGLLRITVDGAECR
ncbi:carbohydrate-binding domain-containing protein [Actinocrispum sp. NPDC049592]|uniref:carbohydrate-binding domain-containing protein n=1 Tax=Actinocrispum sp. NPDC049592 TaxID=3154835 RepID=UPI0034145DBE